MRPRLATLAESAALKTLAGLAAGRGVRVWLCGGALRDLLLGMDAPDLDLAVEDGAMGLGRELAARLGGAFVPLKPELDCCRVVAGGLELDLTGLRKPTLAQDLAARDFTINAMAMDLADLAGEHPRLIDPLHGEADLANRRLRLAGPGVLRADPLRVLRAFRFMSTHGMNIGPELAEALAEAGPGLFRVSMERIAVEWIKLTGGPRAGAAIAAMDAAGCLTRLVPTLAFGRGVEQNPFHHLDIFDHNLACLQAVDEIAADPARHMGGQAPETAEYLADDLRRALLKTAALLHDLGKPVTRRQRDDDYATFYNHDLAGGRLARRSAQGLGLSKAQQQRVELLVREHMRPFHLMGAWRLGNLTPKAVRRMVTAQGEHLAGVFILAMADTMAGRGPQRPADAEAVLLDLYAQVAELRDRELSRRMQAPPLIDGRELMDALGLEPGPRVGELLGAVREAQLDGEIGDRAEALALASEILRGRPTAG